MYGQALNMGVELEGVCCTLTETSVQEGKTRYTNDF